MNGELYFCHTALHCAGVAREVPLCCVRKYLDSFEALLQIFEICFISPACLRSRLPTYDIRLAAVGARTLSHFVC